MPNDQIQWRSDDTTLETARKALDGAVVPPEAKVQIESAQKPKPAVGQLWKRRDWSAPQPIIKLEHPNSTAALSSGWRVRFDALMGDGWACVGMVAPDGTRVMVGEMRDASSQPGWPSLVEVVRVKDDRLVVRAQDGSEPTYRPDTLSGWPLVDKTAGKSLATGQIYEGNLNGSPGLFELIAENVAIAPGIWSVRNRMLPDDSKLFAVEVRVFIANGAWKLVEIETKAPEKRRGVSSAVEKAVTHGDPNARCPKCRTLGQVSKRGRASDGRHKCHACLEWFAPEERILPAPTLTLSSREQHRQAIDRVLAEHAATHPAYATARRAAVVAACERREVGPSLAEVKGLLDNLVQHEEEHRDSLAWRRTRERHEAQNNTIGFGTASLAYEKARSAKRGDLEWDLRVPEEPVAKRQQAIRAAFAPQQDIAKVFGAFPSGTKPDPRSLRPRPTREEEAREKALLPADGRSPEGAK